MRPKSPAPSISQSAVEYILTPDRFEEARIHEVYGQRDEAKHSRYSFLVPSYVLEIQGRERELLSMLGPKGVDSLEGKKVLEIGCGTGLWLRAFIQWGVPPENIFGIDLLPGRIEQAKRRCPKSVHLECGSATTLAFSEASFDFVLQSTVFTSVLDAATRQRIAAEMLRVLKPKGFVLWYDFHVNNPRNTDVRGVSKHEIRKLFPGCQIQLRRITLAPPIGRFVGRYSPLLYALLSRARFLCTHYLCLITKQ